MILVNSQRARLRQFNRKDEENYFDDQNYRDIIIKVVPYNVDDVINFGKYTHPEAKGYFQVNGNVDVQEGDQITFIGKFKNKKLELATRTMTVISVEDAWLFNKVENKMVVVK